MNSLNLRKDINQAIRSITNSFFMYRPVAKQQKMNVLMAAKNYLKGDLSHGELLQVIHKNPRYADALFSSNTKKIIEAVVEIKGIDRGGYEQKFWEKNPGEWLTQCKNNNITVSPRHPVFEDKRVSHLQFEYLAYKRS